MPHFWIQTPSDQALSESQTWTKIGTNRYAAFRFHLLVVPGQENSLKNGPIHKQVEWPIDATYRVQDKITKITKHEFVLQEAITSSVTNKISREAIGKVSSSATGNLAGLSATMGTEVQRTTGNELVKFLQDVLSTTSTLSVETSSETLTALEFKVLPKSDSIQTRTVFVFFKLRELYWKVFLSRVEYLELEYEKNWVWPDVRKTVKTVELDLKIPLFKISYYEPVTEFSYAFDSYTPQVEDATIIRSEVLSGSEHPSATPKISTRMEELAKLAFPTSRKEKQEAHKAWAVPAHRPRKKTTRISTKSAKKRSAKKK